MSIVSAGVVWDNHACMPLRTNDEYLGQIERYRENGVNVVSLNVGFAEIGWEDHVMVLAYMRQWFGRQPEKYRLIKSANDARRCKADGKLGITFDIEGMWPVQDNLHLVQAF